MRKWTPAPTSVVLMSLAQCLVLVSCVGSDTSELDEASTSLDEPGVLLDDENPVTLEFQRHWFRNEYASINRIACTR